MFNLIEEVNRVVERDNLEVVAACCYYTQDNKPYYLGLQPFIDMVNDGEEVILHHIHLWTPEYAYVFTVNQTIKLPLSLDILMKGDQPQ